ncbi:MAG: hypothetical protein ACRD1Z_15030, partial [Vicinamibacteria bacterium]
PAMRPGLFMARSLFRFPANETLRRRVALGAPATLLTTAWLLLAGAPGDAAQVWDVLAPLADGASVRPGAQAFGRSDELKAALSAFVFRRAYEPELDRSLGVVLNGFDTFDLRDLYKHPDVSWRSDEGSAERYFLFRGEKVGDRFDLRLTDRPGGAHHLGEFDAR